MPACHDADTSLAQRATAAKRPGPDPAAHVARAHIHPIGMRHFIDAKVPDTVHIGIGYRTSVI
jgi:hypothetical protein